MALRLRLAEPLPPQLRGCAEDQLRSAIAQLDDGGADAGGVRQARKSIKKTRAVLRLARPAMPRAELRRQSRALRDAARALAPVRDADMLGPALDALARRYAGQLPAAAFEDARAELERRAGGRVADADEVAAAVADGRRRLEAVLDDVPSWPVDRCDAAAAVAGCARVYGRGRKAWRAARREPTGAALHEWRKHVKDLWYHERLLRDLWPDLLAAQLDEAKRLADLLGEEHDLAVLGAALDGHAPELLPLVEERRRELVAAAGDAGARVYAESPRAFADRLRRLARAA